MNYPTNQDVMDAIARKNEQFLAQVSAKAKADGYTAELGANWFTCAACEAGLNVTLAATILIGIAAFPEDMAVIGPIAVACGISEAVVTGIFASFASGGAAALESIIGALCKAMNACD